MRALACLIEKQPEVALPKKEGARESAAGDGGRELEGAESGAERSKANRLCR